MMKSALFRKMSRDRLVVLISAVAIFAAGALAYAFVGPLSAQNTAPKPVQQASNGETPSVSAIGQLSSGDGSDLRSQTDASIQSTDRALKQITRPLSDTEKKTAAQITEFLKQARSALGSGDVDGAHTLALKAKVLLDQLTK